MQLVQAQPSLDQSQLVPSSVASTANKEHYPVDDIDRAWPCSLVITYGLRSLTKQVATGLAIPGRQYHNAPIPDAYCRVEVQTVMSGQEDFMLDIPGPEGIDTLGQAIKNFILWPRRDVRLIDPPQPSPSATSPSTSVAKVLMELHTGPPSPMHHEVYCI